MRLTFVVALVALAMGCAAIPPASSQIRDESARYQDWVTIAEKHGVAAATRNLAGDILAYACEVEVGCKWVLSVRRPCEDDLQVAALGNSGSGSVAHLTVECSGEAGQRDSSATRSSRRTSRFSWSIEPRRTLASSWG